MDGTVVEQLIGPRLRPGRQHPQPGGPPRGQGRRAAAGEEIRHHFEMSLFGCGKALNEGFFHLLVIACRDLPVRPRPDRVTATS